MKNDNVRESSRGRRQRLNVADVQGASGLTRNGHGAALQACWPGQRGDTMPTDMSATERAYRRLKTDILDGRLSAGPLDIRTLADHMHMININCI